MDQPRKARIRSDLGGAVKAVIRISRGGRTRLLYEEAAAAIGEARLQTLMSRIGEPTIRRASHVEPAPGGAWTADMSPSGGPMLGPFPLRKDALAAEVAWLREHHIG